MRNALDNMLNTLGQSALKIAVFLGILLVGWIVARILQRVVDRLLDRVGFDHAVERGGLKRWLGQLDPSQFAARLVFYTVLLFTLQMAFGVFGNNPVSDLIRGVVNWLPKAFVALVIVVVAAAIANAVHEMIVGALGGLSYGKLLAKIAQVTIIAVGAIAALNQIGVANSVTMPILVAALATVAGILIVGVGGGMIQPMQSRWDRMLNRAEQETGAVRQQLAQNAENKAKDATQPAFSGSYADDVSQATEEVKSRGHQP